MVHHVALALALLALGQAALRVAGTVSPGGLERAIVAVVIAVATAVAQGLALGLVGLGGSPVALVLATVALWAAALVWLPSPEPGLAQRARPLVAAPRRPVAGCRCRPGGRVRRLAGLAAPVSRDRL